MIDDADVLLPRTALDKFAESDDDDVSQVMPALIQNHTYLLKIGRTLQRAHFPPHPTPAAIDLPL